MDEPAPYGGLMTKTLDDEKEREARLIEQAIEVTVNNQTEVLRPEALHLRGVDSLSTEDIKAFIDYYTNYVVEEKEEIVEGEGEVIKKFVYEQLPLDEQITFKVQWINDSSVNIAFQSHEDSYKALKMISITSSNPNSAAPEPKFNDQAYIADIVQERETKPFNPVIEFRKQQNLLNRLGGDIETNNATEKGANDESAGMDEDESSVVLFVRQSFQSDRKVKNASAYSRYYLLHGEPERKPYRKHKYRQRESINSRGRERDSEDLFADKLKKRKNGKYENHEEEEDLFADKLRQRDRSPSRA